MTEEASMDECGVSELKVKHTVGGLLCERKANENVGPLLHGSREIVNKDMEMTEVLFCLSFHW